MSQKKRIKSALISVFNKEGLAPVVKKLNQQGVTIFSTGGTQKFINDLGITVVPAEEITEYPSILGGRVKTLHPKIFGGILNRQDNPQDIDEMEAFSIPQIDAVIVDLYPFEKTVASGASVEDIIEKIDIGGISLIRAAAKNYADVICVSSVDDYAEFLELISANNGTISEEDRKRFAGKAFNVSSHYDAAIFNYFNNDTQASSALKISQQEAKSLRYGENPHQQAALYKTGQNRPGVASASQIQGKPLSYNNINDTDAAFELVAEFDKPTIAIIKHANPCGVASGDNLATAWQTALAADPISAFGGIIAMNRPLDAETATAVASIFTEVVIAPDASDDAKAIMAAKPNLRLLITGDMPDQSTSAIKIKSVAGGFLAQSRDSGMVSADDLKIVTKRAPSTAEIADMLFAWKVTKHVKSNAIVFVKDASTAGIGAGQMSRVDAARIAVHKASDIAEIHGWPQSRTIGSVAASDAFFPFADGLEALIKAGATAVIQPGGSVKDNEVIAAADAAGIAMVFTGMRHFNH